MPRTRRKNKKYSKEFKKKAVQAYLNGEGSLREISKRLKITDKESLRKLCNQHIGKST